jgi:HSP20 family protein
MTVMRNPWYEIARANREMAERMAENGGNRTYRLALNAYETDNEIVISAAVPGLDPENIHINLEDDVLTIEGEFDTRTEDVTYLLRERADEGRFQRTLRLNVAVDVEHIEAVFNNGMLTLTLPKAPEARPLTIPVKKAAQN